MYKRAAAACFSLAGLATAGQGAGILNFAGATTEVWSDGGPGIFNVASSNSPIRGNINFDPTAFTPTLTVPSGSPSLNAYTGGAGSVHLTVSDSGGSSAMDVTSALLLLCLDCQDSWSLLLSSDHLALSLQLRSEAPMLFWPGASVLDLGYPLDSGTTFSGLLSDSSQSLSFAITEVSNSPEPATFGSLLAASGFGWLFLRLRNPAPSAGV
jgi:hypothetical protein